MNNINKYSLTSKAKLKEAMFGAGCFWGVQYNFDQLKGVVETEVGYAGGSTGSPQAVPTYKDVCTGKTGHAEVVYLRYDPAIISYDELLKVFWENHDPTTMNRQGPDVGSQYRSAIFYYDDEQKELAEKSKEGLDKSGKHMNPVVTEIIPASIFYKAEEYHQKYFEKTGQKVCH
ncbi:MAG: peptide-methionine (S)-S-oxide reductase MsrA [Candidatus Yanofskybacteria bacterium]|nr:peptide-methionine (S)-S-oxide reductase MsrA [Candidatus Yanofskybacteria bacterium]